MSQHTQSHIDRQRAVIRLKQVRMALMIRENDIGDRLKATAQVVQETLNQVSSEQKSKLSFDYMQAVVSVTKQHKEPFSGERLSSVRNSKPSLRRNILKI